MIRYLHLLPSTIVLLCYLKQSKSFWQTNIIPMTGGWIERSKISKFSNRIDSLELYSMFDKSDASSFLNNVQSASAPAQTKKEVDTSAQSAGAGSYFDSMGGGGGGGPPPAFSVPKSQDASAQSAGAGSYFDSVGGAKSPEEEAEAEDRRKAGMCHNTHVSILSKIYALT